MDACIFLSYEYCIELLFLHNNLKENSQAMISFCYRKHNTFYTTFNTITRGARNAIALVSTCDECLPQSNPKCLTSQNIISQT